MMYIYVYEYTDIYNNIIQTIDGIYKYKLIYYIYKGKL